MAPHSSTLAWKIPWMEGLVGCSPWGCYELDLTKRLHFHFSLSCIGEGTGNPLQYYCLENPRDGGAWWAAVYGVAQSRTWPKWLSNSSSRINQGFPCSSDGKESACKAGDMDSIPHSGRSPGEGNGNPLVFLPGESHGQRSLMGYSPWAQKESAMNEQLTQN